jgi:hypothetical protein
MSNITISLNGYLKLKEIERRDSMRANNYCSTVTEYKLSQEELNKYRNISDISNNYKYKNTYRW